MGVNVFTEIVVKITKSVMATNEKILYSCIMQLLIDFGHRMRDYRRLRGFSQEKLAELINVAPKTISQWENGKTFIKEEYLPPLCTALNITESDLFCCTVSNSENPFINEVVQIASKIQPSRQNQVLKILKTFLD